MSSVNQEYNENIVSDSGEDNQNPLSNQSLMFNNINTKISDYTADDIFGLLEIKIDDYDNYESFKKDANEKINKYVEFFEKSNNFKLVDFFKEIRSSLFGDENVNNNMTEAQKLLEIYTERDENIKNSQNMKIIENNINVVRESVTKLLTVDTRFRSNYLASTSTDFDINLPYIINNVTELRLSDVEFPATFYPFQEEFENNYMWLKYTFNYSTDTSVSYDKYIYFYITPGNYYQDTLITNMQTVIDTEGLPLTISHDLDFDNDGGVGDGTGTLTIEYSGDTTNSIVITDLELNFRASKILEGDYNYNASHIIDSDDDKIEKYYNTDSSISHYQRMGWMLGFRDSLYTGSTSYTSEGQLDVIGPRYVYLLVNDFNSSSNVNFFSNSETSLLSDNILGRISLKTGAFSVQSQNDFTVYGEPRYFFGPVNIDRLHVKVIDEFGRTVNLNGMDFSFSIQMTVKHNVSTTS